MQRTVKAFVITAVTAFLAGGLVLAQAQPTQDQIRDRDIYGYQLMNPQERDEYRARMRAANTVQEREQIRAEHHAQMQARAKERGLSLPEQPPMGGPEIRRGPGTGGPGAGGGMGGGRRY